MSALEEHRAKILKRASIFCHSDEEYSGLFPEEKAQLWESINRLRETTSTFESLDQTECDLTEVSTNRLNVSEKNWNSLPTELQSLVCEFAYQKPTKRGELNRLNMIDKRTHSLSVPFRFRALRLSYEDYVHDLLGLFYYILPKYATYIRELHLSSPRPVCMRQSTQAIALMEVAICFLPRLSLVNFLHPVRLFPKELFKTLKIIQAPTLAHASLYAYQNQSLSSLENSAPRFIQACRSLTSLSIDCLRYLNALDFRKFGAIIASLPSLQVLFCKGMEVNILFDNVEWQSQLVELTLIRKPRKYPHFNYTHPLVSNQIFFKEILAPHAKSLKYLTLDDYILHSSPGIFRMESLDGLQLINSSIDPDFLFSVTSLCDLRIHESQTRLWGWQEPLKKELLQKRLRRLEVDQKDFSATDLSEILGICLERNVVLEAWEGNSWSRMYKPLEG